MVVNAVAENVFGTMGTICWSIQLIPQIWKSYRDKSTKGLSTGLLSMWAISGLLYGIYAVVHNINIPIIVQPQLFCALTLVSLVQCQYYSSKRPVGVCCAILGVLFLVCAGFELGMVFVLRPSYAHGNERPVAVVGTLATVFNALGFLPQYYEIYKHQEVIGISLGFLATDICGGTFSTLCLIFKEKFDVVSGITFGIVILGDLLIVLAYIVLNPRAKRRRLTALVNTSSLQEAVLKEDWKGPSHIFAPMVVIHKTNELPRVFIIGNGGTLLPPKASLP